MSSHVPESTTEPIPIVTVQERKVPTRTNTVNTSLLPFGTVPTHSESGINMARRAMYPEGSPNTAVSSDTSVSGSDTDSRIPENTSPDGMIRGKPYYWKGPPPVRARRPSVFGIPPPDNGNRVEINTPPDLSHYLLEGRRPQITTVQVQDPPPEVEPVNRGRLSPEVSSGDQPLDMSFRESVLGNRSGNISGQEAMELLRLHRHGRGIVTPPSTISSEQNNTPFNTPSPRVSSTTESEHSGNGDSSPLVITGRLAATRKKSKAKEKSIHSQSADPGKGRRRTIRRRSRRTSRRR